MIIHNGSSENIVSRVMVDKLQLPTTKHHSPYSIGWIKKVNETKITKQCTISFSIGKNYKDQILCNVVNMEACHMLLGRPWQSDCDATHRGRDNVYIFVKDS